MTTVYENNPDSPGIHVFVIGVGYYHHLRGGRAANAAAEDFDLEQLSSPAASAVSIANWFRNRLRDDGLSGSIELLISSNPQSRFDGITLEGATRVNVDAAFNRWFGRGNLHQENICIFYFCGHGVEKTDLLLLLEDLGAQPLRRFENAINFHKTYQGMSRCAARTQCYFIDSCRQNPTALHELIDDSGGTALIDPLARGMDYQRNAPVVMATAPGLAAFGKSKSPSRFASALIEALDGSGSEHINGQWCITTGRIGVGISSAMRRSQNTEHAQMSCIEGQVINPQAQIIPLPNAPIVPVCIASDPHDAIDGATINVMTTARAVHQTRSPEPGSWRITLPASMYIVQAMFNGGSAPCEESLWAAPPSAEVTVKKL